MTLPLPDTCRGDALRAGATVADAMLAGPKTCPPATTVEQARAVLADDHVHAVLVVDGRQLLAVVERADLEGAPGAASVVDRGRLDGRTVAPDADVEEVRQAMTGRRLAVVDGHGALLGLLCRKRHGRGFCSREDVEARERERAERAAE
ncbi:CBS domain-containing protein [Actinomycetospora straminea]|uniref:CBS domain-containing protein n=1 Tax=Actinomycetospora straminea TaxID=663607 RepID=A0ABP9F137_9PSEU|nr:CBS domain-containing protein [Actinomycetospora straminea]MDD7935776.1 CBS domain-containing protein [Actinomycetospora straminea]